MPENTDGLPLTQIKLPHVRVVEGSHWLEANGAGARSVRRRAKEVPGEVALVREEERSTLSKGSHSGHNGTTQHERHMDCKWTDQWRQ